MNKISSILVIIAVLTLTAFVQADCRGCCSRHKGVVCIDGVTLCRDGSSLSHKCQSKQRNKCDETPIYQLDSEPIDYNLKDWPHWIDADNDCQNTRAEILLRDNIGTIKFKRNRPCNVCWVCPYTGKVFTKASDMDIDHVVPLSHALKTGGAGWSREKKQKTPPFN